MRAYSVDFFSYPITIHQQSDLFDLALIKTMSFFPATVITGGIDRALGAMAGWLKTETAKV